MFSLPMLLLGGALGFIVGAAGTWFYCRQKDGDEPMFGIKGGGGPGSPDDPPKGP